MASASTGRALSGRSIACLALVFAVLTAGHLVWDARAHRMPTFDQAAHLTKGMAYGEAIASGRFINEFSSVPANYPPIFHILVGLGTLVLGPIAPLGLYVNLLALAVIIGGTYVIGTQLVNERVALVSAIVVALYPGLGLYTREALQEVVIAAATVVCMAFLIGSRLCERRAPSLLFGVSLGAGLLVKPTFAFHVWLPALGAALLSLRHLRLATLANVAMAVIAAIGVAALWYGPHWQGIVALGNANRSDAIALGNPTNSGEGFQVLWAAYGSGLTTPLGLYVGVAAVVFCALRYARRLWPLHAWIIGAWLMAIFAIVFRDEKNLLATLPALAVLIVSMLDSIPVTAVRLSVMLTFIGLEALSWTSAEFGRPALAGWPLIEVRSQYAGMGGGEPRLPEIVAAMTGSSPAKPMKVAVVPNEARLNANTLEWQARRTGAVLRFEQISYAGYFSIDAALRRAMVSDWVLLKTGSQGDPATVDTAEELNAGVRGAPRLFSLVGSFGMADGSQAEVYKVIAPAVTLATDTQVREVVDASDPVYRGVMFGDRFRLLGVTTKRRTDGFWDSQGLVLRLAWEAVIDGPLDRLVCVHLVDDEGKILNGADYRQSPRDGVSVAAGARWIDELLIQDAQLGNATSAAICLYHLTEPHLKIDRGPTDWDGSRLRIPVPPRPPAGRGLANPVSRLP